MLDNRNFFPALSVCVLVLSFVCVGSCTSPGSGASSPQLASSPHGVGPDSRAGSAESASREIFVPGVVRPLGTLLPPDPGIVGGRLDNGLVWNYLPREGDRLCVSLRVAAGALLEADNEQGFAHFVEHMAFNGSRHFKPGEMSALMLQSKAWISGFTTHDSTTFEMIVPASDAELVEKAFWFMQDIASGILFLPEETEMERGVVLEELRKERDPEARARGDGFLWGPAFELRNVIGTSACLKGATASSLKAFWSRWYRPELMSLAITGTWPGPALESMIQENLGAAAVAVPPGPAPNPPRGYPVPATVNQVRIDTLANIPAPRATIQRVVPPLVEGTEESMRERVLAIVLGELYKSRWQRIVATQVTPVRGVGCQLQIGASLCMSPLQLWTFDFNPAQEGQLVDPVSQFEAVVRENERLIRHGFDEWEWNIAKPLAKDVVGQLWPDTLPPLNVTVSNLHRYVLGAGDAAVPVFKRTLAFKILEGLTLEDLNKACADWLRPQDLRIRLVVPEAGTQGGRYETARLTEKKVAGVFGQIAAEQIAPLVAAPPVLEPELSPPQAGKTISRDIHQSSGIKEWRLSNGSRVLWIKPGNDSSGRFAFRAWAPGGLNDLADSEVPAGRLASEIAMASPAGGMNAWAVFNYCRQKEMSIGSFIGNAGHGFEGEGSLYELEAFLKLIHAQSIRNSMDQSIVERVRSGQYANLGARSSDSRSVGDDHYRTLIGAGDIRLAPLAQADLATLEGAAILDIWKRFFGDARGFTWIFAGALDGEELQALAEVWLASIPSRGAPGGEVQWRAPSEGVPQRRLPTGGGATVVPLDYSGAADVQFRVDGLVGSGMPDKGAPDARRLSWNDFAMAELACRILQDRMFFVLREELGGLYAPEAEMSETWNPLPFWTIHARFPCESHRAPDLQKAFLNIVDDLGKELVDDQVFAEQLLRQANARKRWQRSLGGMADLINYVVQTGLPLNAPYDAYQQLGAVDPGAFRDWCKANLGPDRWVNVTVKPLRGSF